MNIMEQVSELKIVKAVISKYRLTDDGKVNNFINAEIDIAKRAIEILNRNIEADNFNLKGKIIDIDRAIADAIVDVEDAYEAITPEEVSNNAKSRAFSEIYWANITTAETVLLNLKKEKEKIKSDHKETIDAYEEQIIKQQNRVTKLSETAEA